MNKKKGGWERASDTKSNNNRKWQGLTKIPELQCLLATKFLE